MSGLGVVAGGPGEAAARQDAVRRPRLLSVFVLSSVLSACSIVYELLIAQTLAMLAANTVIWYSLVIGTFLLAMGVGAYWSRWGGRHGPWGSLLRIELALTLCGGLAVLVVHLGHAMCSHLALAAQPGPAFLAFYGSAAASVIVIGVLTGAELPQLMRLARLEHDARGVENVVLGLDYVGSLIGAVSFPLLLIPNLSLPAIGFATALINLGAAIYIFAARAETKGRARCGVAIGVLALAIGVGFVEIGAIRQYLLRRYYYYTQLGNSWMAPFLPRPDLPAVLRASSPYQRIDLIKDVAPDYSGVIMAAYSDKLEKDPTYPVDQILFLNGDFQTNTRYDEIYHEWFAHVPIIVNHAVPRHVLLLGGGDGFLLRELVKYDGIETITHIDIDTTLIGLAKTNDVLRHANHDSFRDPRVHTTFTDGFVFARTSDRQFDAIYIDFPAAADYDLAKLYSREFFHFIRERIAPGGFAVFDATGTSYMTSRNTDGRRFLSPRNDWPIYYNTLKQAGFPTIVPYLTTLESDNAKAIELLSSSNIVFEGDVGDRLASIVDDEQREREHDRILSNVVGQLIEAHVVALEQGFIMLAPEPRDFDYAYHDPGVELHVLNELRFRLAFATQFPRTDRVDPALVNSILRPRFPTIPWWEPRLPY